MNIPFVHSRILIHVMKGATPGFLLTKYLGWGKGGHSHSNEYTPAITRYAMGVYLPTSIMYIWHANFQNNGKLL